MRKGSGLLIALLVIAIAAPAAARSTIGADELLERLERAEVLAESGVSSPSSEQMSKVRAALGFPVEVDLDGWTGSLEPDPTLEALQGETPGDFERALTRIEALRGAVASAVAAPPVDRAEIDAALDAAYRGVIEARPGLLERMWRAVEEFIGGLAYRLFTFEGAGTFIAWAVLLGVVVAAFLLLRRLNIVPDRRTRSRAETSHAGQAIDWSRRAEEAIRSGDLKEAIRALYRVLLATLARRGILPDAPGLTAGECRAVVRGSAPRLFEAVAEATGSFERVTYGGIAPRPTDIDALRRAEDLARSA